MLPKRQYLLTGPHNKVFDLLECYTALICIYRRFGRAYLSYLKSIPVFSLDCLALIDRTDRLSQKCGN